MEDLINNPDKNKKGVVLGDEKLEELENHNFSLDRSKSVEFINPVKEFIVKVYNGKKQIKTRHSNSDQLPGRQNILCYNNYTQFRAEFGLINCKYRFGFSPSRKRVQC